MTAIHFYHLTTSPLERAMPALLQKMHEVGHKTLVLCEDEARMKQLNELLWTFQPDSFLPHGSTAEPRPDVQPILLATEPDAKNAANMLLVTDGRTPDELDNYDRVLDMFNGNDDEAVQQARVRWKIYKDSGRELHYWQQTSQGGWDKKS